jgi:hypothetical protein
VNAVSANFHNSYQKRCSGNQQECTGR